MYREVFLWKIVVRVATLRYASIQTIQEELPLRPLQLIPIADLDF